MILMTRDMVLVATETAIGIITGDAMPTNDLTALKAQGVTANGTDMLNPLDLIRTPLSSYLHDLTITGAGCLTTQQRIGWKRFCRLCFDSAHFVSQCVLYFFFSSS